MDNNISNDGNVTQTTAVTDEPQPVQNQPIDPPKQKRSRRVVLAGIIFAVVVALLAAASAFGLVYQNPEKVVTDSIINALKAKNVSYALDLESKGDTELTINLVGNAIQDKSHLAATITFKLEDESKTVNAETLVDQNQDIYFKVKNLKDLVADVYAQADESELPSSINELVTKYDDRWVKISNQDLKSFSEESAVTQRCAADLSEKLRSDKAAINQVSDAYRNNRFIIIKNQSSGQANIFSYEPGQSNSFSYELFGDEAKAKSFIAQLKTTDIYKQFKACDSSFDLDENEIFQPQSNESDTSVIVSIDRFSHQLTKLEINSKEKDSTNAIKLVVSPVFDTDQSFVEKQIPSTPSDTLTLTQLQEDFQSLLVGDATFSE